MDTFESREQQFLRDTSENLYRLCGRPTELGGVISDETFVEIAGCLKDLGNKDQSKRPRTYAVLYMMSRVDLLYGFINEGLLDNSFPYSSRRALPSLLQQDPDACDEFLALQTYVLSPGCQMEKGRNGQHVGVKSGDSFFELLGKLGKGGEATVDKVRSRFTNEIYARKRIHRQHDLRKDKVVIKKFENELQILKRLDHPHLVKVFGSYSDNKYVAFIMKPVATLDLKKYLRTCEGHLNNGERVRFRTYYGCLATAVAYLHENDIRHKDIKPNNILLKNNDIYITDFGTAIEFDEGQSITKGTVKTKTPAYQSPEVARGAKRGRSSDIWSLGVTFFEMTTILRGETLDTMQDFLSKTGTKQTFVCENLEGALKWTEYLVKNVNFEKVDNAPMQWIKDMLNPKPAARPTALDLSEQIKQTAEGAFMNKCCRFDGSTDSETDLSNDSENDEDVTIVAPVSIPPSEAKLRDKSLNHPRKSVVGEDPLHDTSYFRPAPIHRAVMSMSRVFSYVPKFSFPSFYLKPNTTLDQIPPPVLPDPLQWEFPPPSDQYSYALPGSFPGYDDTSQPVAYSRPMPYPSISEQVQDDYDPAAHNISILAAKAAMQNAARRDEVSEVNSPPRPAEVLPDRFEPTTEERQPYVAASLTYKTDVGYVTENTSMPPQETPSEVPQNRPSSPITYLEPALADFEVPEAPLHFEEYLFNPGAKGFIVYILGSSDRSFQTLKDLLLYPSTKLRHSRSDDNLEIQRRTILILKSTEFLEDDTAVFLRRRSSIAGSRLPEELSEYTRSETFDKLKWAKMSLDKSALFSSPRSSKGIYEQTPEVPNAPATTGDLTNKFFQNLSQLYDGEALLDPNKPSKHDRRPPSPQAPVTPRPSTRANPLVSWLANARSPLGPSRQSPGPKLTGENLGAHNRQVPPVRRSPLPFKLETASNFMKEVYNDAASSVPTSVMSTKTRERFKLAGLFLPSQDRTLNYLGEYTKLGKADAVRLLLKQGCNPGTKTSPRNGPIFNVVRGASSRHTKCLRALIKHGVNVNIRSSRNGKTPLLEAIESEPWSGYVNVIYLLLAAGANPNAKDSSGDSPLLKLLGSGLTPLSEHHRKALALLLSTSYKTNVAVTPLGTRNKPLHLAIRRRDPWAVGMLLERNASLIEAENSEGLTPLSLAVTSWSDNTMSKAQLEILDLLLEKGANVNVRIMLTRKTPLHVAVLHGLVDAVERLLGYGADTTLTTGCGETMMELLGDRKKQHGCDHTCDDCRTIEVLLATVN